MKEETAERGRKYPLDNVSYDLITIIQNKSQALSAYDTYLEDAEGNDELCDLLEEMRNSDEEYISQLQQHLGQSISTGTEAVAKQNIVEWK